MSSRAAGPSAQIPLSFPPRQRYRLDGFLGQANQELVKRLGRLSGEDGFTCLWLYGTSGVGKTHLLQAACASAGDRSVAYLAPPVRPDRLAGLDDLALLAIDDIESWAGSEEAERALMALYEGMFALGGKLVAAATHVPGDVAWRRPDLASRFGAAACYAVSEPDDGDKRQLLGQLARARGLEIPGPVASYLLTHAPRGVGDLRDAVDCIDRATLAARRRVTVPFVKQVLGLR